MKILVFHPSVAPFIQEAAKAFHEDHTLEYFITTVSNQPEKLWQKALCALGKVMGKDLQRQLNRRSIYSIPGSKIRDYPFRELLRLASGQVDKDGRLTDLVWEWAETGFDRYVARQLHGGLTAVYGYEHSSLATFLRAKEMGLKIIYELPAAEPLYAQNLLESEIAQFPELNSPYHRYTAARESRRIARRQHEWELADRVICASNFTKNTFSQAGVDTSKVRIVNYGSPPPLSQNQLETADSFFGRKPLFLWSGTFGVRKGAHYLLKAWEQGNFGRYASLHVYGALALPPSRVHPLPEGIRLMGSIPRPELMNRYRDSDALLFPTLCDGFGMVATEAWSSGLPVITTIRAGASDLLRHGKNGLLIEAASSDSLGQAIDWCLSHRQELFAMKTACLETAAGWQWKDFRQRLREAVRC